MNHEKFADWFASKDFTVLEKMIPEAHKEYYCRTVWYYQQEKIETLQEELDKIKADDQNELTKLSKKLATTLKTGGVDEMVNELQMNKSKVIDHFTMAYMAEMDLKPSEIKLVQGMDNDGYFEMYFVKSSNIILPGE